MRGQGVEITLYRYRGRVLLSYMHGEAFTPSAALVARCSPAAILASFEIDRERGEEKP